MTTTIGLRGSGVGQKVLRAAGAILLLSSQMGGCLDRNLGSGTTKAMVTLALSLAPDGNTASGSSSSPSMSGDGRYVVFVSSASNLVSGDSNGFDDVFLMDRQAGTVTLISRKADGTASDGHSSNPALSRNGRYVVFTSKGKLTTDVTDQTFRSVFIRDLQEGKIRSVQIASGGGSEGSSPFVSDTARVVWSMGVDIWFRDMSQDPAPAKTLVSHYTGDPSITNGGTSVLPMISSDGSFVVFESDSQHVTSTTLSTLSRVYRSKTDQLSADATLISVSRAAASASADGASHSPSVSSDGRYVAFETVAPNILKSGYAGPAQIVLRDCNATTNTTVLVSAGSVSGDIGFLANNICMKPRISADGRFVCFWSIATDLGGGNTAGYYHAFLRDLTGGIQIATVTTSGELANLGELGTSAYAKVPPALSDDGKYVAFEMLASNLVPNDLNGASDIFVRGPMR